MATEKVAVSVEPKGVLDPEVVADFLEEHECDFTPDALWLISQQMEEFLKAHIKEFGFISNTTLRARPIAVGVDPSWEARLQTTKQYRRLKSEEEMKKKKCS